MKKPLLLRTIVLLLGVLACTSCATPVEFCAVRPEADPWIGANLGVLYYYLGPPDSVEIGSDGRVGFSYSALVAREESPRNDQGPMALDLDPVKFWVVDDQVVEVTGDVFDRFRDQSTLVLWGRSNRRLSAPQYFDRREWDRRLGLAHADPE